MSFKKWRPCKNYRWTFTGIIGKIGRAAGQQRVIVELSGIGNIATAYISNSFMIKIDALTLKEI